MALKSMTAGKRAAARPYPVEASEAEVERMEAAVEVIAELQLTAEQLKVSNPVRICKHNASILLASCRACN